MSQQQQQSGNDPITKEEAQDLHQNAIEMNLARITVIGSKSPSGAVKMETILTFRFGIFESILALDLENMRKLAEQAPLALQAMEKAIAEHK